MALSLSIPFDKSQKKPVPKSKSDKISFNFLIYSSFEIYFFINSSFINLIWDNSQFSIRTDIFFSSSFNKETFKGLISSVFVFSILSNHHFLEKTILVSLLIFSIVFKISFKSNREGIIQASDIQEINGLEIINKDQYICTIAKGGSLEFDLFLREGRGFIDFEENKSIIEMYGPKLESKIKVGQFLAIDSDFSPVMLCNFTKEDLNTASPKEVERLKITVKTNGTIDAKSAMKEAAETIVAHFKIIGNVDELESLKVFEETQKKQEKVAMVSIPIERLNLTIRSLNALKRSKYNTVDELLKLTEEELSNIKNLGKKSIEDIAEKLRNWKEKHQDQNQENESNLGEGE